MRAVDRASLPLDAAEAARLLAPLTRLRKVALAVSGGADSVALMRLAAAWRGRVEGAPDLSVLTVDHGLRPGSAEEARMVRIWAEECGLPCRILGWRRDAVSGNLQAQARAARYRLMAQACQDEGAEALVTAHHLDDQAETFLLRLARGSGVDGLGAMSQATRIFGVTVLRPLLDVPRGRLVATLDALAQSFIDDPSNESDAFARVRMRALMARLAEEGMTAQRLAATARRMRRARAALDAATDALAQAVARLDPLVYCTLSSRLADAHDDIALRLLTRIVMAVSGSPVQPAEAGLERMLGMLRSAEAGGMTLSGCRMSLARQGAAFFRETGRGGLPKEALMAERHYVWDGRFDVYLPAGSGPLELRALGGDGIAAIRRAGAKLRPGSRIAATCPSFWSGNELVFAPLILENGGDFGLAGTATVTALASLGASE